MGRITEKLKTHPIGDLRCKESGHALVPRKRGDSPAKFASGGIVFLHLKNVHNNWAQEADHTQPIRHWTELRNITAWQEIDLDCNLPPRNLRPKLAAEALGEILKETIEELKLKASLGMAKTTR